MNGLLENLKQNAMVELSVQRKNVDIIERAKAHAKTKEAGDEEAIFEVAVDEAPAEGTASKEAAVEEAVVVPAVEEAVVQH